jgi:hypothetical protein
MADRLVCFVDLSIRLTVYNDKEQANVSLALYGNSIRLLIGCNKQCHIVVIKGCYNVLRSIAWSQSGKKCNALLIN